MANDLYISTRRDGNWSRPQQYHNSPWWVNDADAVPDFVPLAVRTITVAHDLTMDIDVDCGASLQAAIWEPLTVSVLAGFAETELATGHYTVAASVVSAVGETQVGNSLSTTFLLTQAVSKPRVTFASLPPTACFYNLYLDDPAHPGRLTLYCSGINGAMVDLESGSWGNSYSGSTASGGALTSGGAAEPISSGRSSAITVSSAGSLILLPGKTLLHRGDVVVESPSGSTKPYIQVGAGARMRADGSLAVDPDNSRYLVRYLGGGDIRFLG